ncbi:MAG: polysaccharide deacetylase family protein [Chloroflexota bacterium]
MTTQNQLRLILLINFITLFGLACGWGMPTTSRPPSDAPVFVTVTPKADQGVDRDADASSTIAYTADNSTGQEVSEGVKSLGQVMILEYHLIGDENNELQRTPDTFRTDLERLHQQGYTPVNLIDMMGGFPDLPVGKKPIILTFDDSHISQFHLLPNGELDPDSAVGILYQFHLDHPNDWPLRATFFVLLDNGLDGTLFGQPDLANQKLSWLVEQGFEIGSHTVTHVDLAQSDGYTVVEELAESQRRLEAMLPGYDVRSFAVPYGSLPLNEDYLMAGYYDGAWYTYENSVLAWGGPAPSPHSEDFKPFRLPRIPVTDSEFDYWTTYFEQNPNAYYKQGFE